MVEGPGQGNAKFVMVRIAKANSAEGPAMAIDYVSQWIVA
jgi:hypothetical protein